jgi:hypothetical protein
MDNHVLVNFHWFVPGASPGDHTKNFMMQWPVGMPLPRKGEIVDIPTEDYFHRVERVEYTISLPQDRDTLHSTVSIIDIRTIRTFNEKQKEHKKKAGEEERQKAWTKPVVTVYPPAPGIPKPWEDDDDRT